MAKVFWRSRQKLQKSTDNNAGTGTGDGSFNIPTGLTSTTAGRYTGTDGEVFNTTTGALLSTINISSSTNATPIVVTTSSAHNLVLGQRVIIAGHLVNTNANGTWIAVPVTTTTFQLTNSVGNGVGVATGTMQAIVEDLRDALAIPSITGSSHGNFTSNDVGRLIKLTNTNPASGTAGTRKCENWVFRIYNVISSTVVQLEGARFEDASTAGSGTITWTLMACSSFQATSMVASSDPVAGNGGSCIDRDISIPNPPSGSTVLGYTPWRIGRVDSSTSILINDWTGNIASLPTQSNLTWFMHNRQLFHYQDLYWTIHRFMIACGWTVIGKKATGTITCTTTNNNGDYISIWDGVQRWVFEYNTGSAGSNHVKITPGAGNASTNATNLASAINGATAASGLAANLSASAVGAVVTVTCKLWDARGNTNMWQSGTSFGAITGMSGGQTPGQFRGRNGVFTAIQGIIDDIIYFSPGESDPSNPKRMFVRMLRNNTANNSASVGSGQGGIDWAMFQSWSDVYANTSTYNPGNGINPLSSKTAAANTQQQAAEPATNMGSASMWSQSSAQSSAFIQNWFENIGNGYGLFGGQQITGDFAFLGDRDEVHLYYQVESVGANYIGFGAIQEVNQNAQRFMVRQAATAGSSVAINVGANLDPQGVTAQRGDASQIVQPYQANDNIQAAGLAVNTSAPTGGAFIESDQITSFGTVAASATNPDGLDYSITVATLQKTLAIGDIVGEEAMPMMFYFGHHSTGGVGTLNNCKFQNNAQFNDATFLDWNGHSNANTLNGFQGIDGFGTIGANVMTEINPSKRGGRFGLVPITLRNNNSGQGEFRGRLRYYYYAPSNIGSWQLVSDRNGNWYFIIPYGLKQGNTTSSLKFAMGPISTTLAKPY